MVWHRMALNLPLTARSTRTRTVVFPTVNVLRPFIFEQNAEADDSFLEGTS